MVDYRVYKLAENFYLLRAFDYSTRFFEGLWEIPEGIMYNSYVLTGSEGTVVFDTWKNSMASEYVEALKDIVDPRDVKYVVVHHAEPDHSGALKLLVEKSNPLVLGHPLAKNLVESFYGVQVRFKPVVDGGSLSINEEKIVFYQTPWLHWPETIVSYIAGSRALLSCDIFGAYGVFNREVWIDELSGEALGKYWWLMKKYLANVIGTYREWILKNLEKLTQIPGGVEWILPSHGLLIRGEYTGQVLQKYASWGRGDSEHGKTIIVYSSMYGFAQKTVELVEKYLAEKGVQVKTLGFNDESRAYVSDIIGEAYDAERILFITSTYEADLFPLMRYVAFLMTSKIPRNKRIAVIALYGWGAKAGRILSEILGPAGFSIVETLEFKAGEEEKSMEKIKSLVEKLLSF